MSNASVESTIHVVAIYSNFIIFMKINRVEFFILSLLPRINAAQINKIRCEIKCSGLEGVSHIQCNEDDGANKKNVGINLN